MQPDEALGLLKQGAAQIINESELREKLALGPTVARQAWGGPDDIGYSPRAHDCFAKN